ncbi:MAG: imidazole glycerol phosphate synthase subunit HisF [Rhodothermaceae bacterium]
MLCKRIIPCLDIKDGRVVKGTNFINLRDAGSAVELAKRYYNEGADELIFLDISATEEKRKTLVKMVEEVAREIRIPFTVGGGINSSEDINQLLNAGADKVSLNSAIVKNPDLINEASVQFGAQAIVAAVDVKKVKDEYKVFIKGGKEATDKEAFSWCREVIKRGAGEILITSMDQDGTKNGYDNDFLQKLAENTSVPVIASGGAGTKKHILEGFTKGKADACLAASIFHFNEISICELKSYLAENNVKVRLC